MLLYIYTKQQGEIKMKKYVMVIVKGHNHKIGRNEYTKTQAETRLKELKKAGINNMTIMTKEQAYGL